MDQEPNTFECAVAKGPVALTVSIGEGQLGATTVLRDGKVLVKGGVVIANLNLGDGGDLRGKSINADSIVNDISVHTNRMSVTYVVVNGEQNTRFLSTHTVKTEGDLCRFLTTLKFKS